MPLPEPMGQDRDLRRTRHSIAVRKPSSALRRGSQDRRERWSRPRHLDALGLAGSGDRQRIAAVCGNAVERVRAVAIQEVDAEWDRWKRRCSDARDLVLDADYPVGI